jgi:hypothetical protein
MAEVIRHCNALNSRRVLYYLSLMKVVAGKLCVFRLLLVAGSLQYTLKNSVAPQLAAQVADSS